MQIRDITSALEELAPLQYAQDFDNVGLLVGNHQENVTGVLITLDCLESVVDEAIEKKCNLIVTFHPIIFSGLKHLRETDYVRRTVVKAIKNNIAIYATHTALDMAHGGVSHRMGSQLQLQNVKTLIPENGLLHKLSIHVPQDHLEIVREAIFQAGAGKISNYSDCSFTTSGTGTFQPGEQSQPFSGKSGQRSTVDEYNLEVILLPHKKKEILSAMQDTHPYEEISYQIIKLENEYNRIGMGAIGELPNAISQDDFLATIKNVFNSGVVRSSLSRKRNIKKVAVLGGSGAFAIKNALQAGADAFVTADLKYHDFFQGENILLCDVGHYESEQFTKNLLQEYLTEKFSNFAILCAQAQTNPVNYT
ncbi:Nif3-like dinuclear metal center hexameric protein [Nonlabens ponticola]|uniref:GTP cyclohydrolase 1 type 2 homolog n=1 Tax=Nonlabens ponticola TaxID=2496866 RepID=A0A3S9N0H8_9FLAO|nr:Nif3-like dinuclear metal center hexameric protein [Nonlabens ponticola]AZQ45046.1 Nif3-like dinuclear metal center hexameric protein [Nonlabens ponticola]